MCAEYGQTQSALSGYPFRSREALMAEFGKMQELPFWKGKSFEEVSLEELQARSIKRAEEQEQKEERLSKIEEEKSEVFMPPSAVAAESFIKSRRFILFSPSCSYKCLRTFLCPALKAGLSCFFSDFFLTAGALLLQYCTKNTIYITICK